MAKKNIILLIILIVLGLSGIISLPTLFLSMNLRSYDIIEESEIYLFPEDLSSNVDLNIITDVGDIKIDYIEPSIDNFGKVDVIFDIRGSNLAGKSYNDYLSIDQHTTNSSVSLLLEVISDDWFDSSLWSKQSIIIVISLRSDIIFNIDATIDYGNVELTVPYGVSIGNVHINVSSGNIVYDFNHCIIDGNITGHVNSGDKDITLIANNVKYTQNSIWDLDNNNGKITFNIIQNRAMEGNVTGMGKTSTGQIIVDYQDDSSDIGAMFKFYNYTGGTWYTEYNSWIGFNDPISIGLPPSGSMFTSYDFPSGYNYKLSFFLEHEEQMSYMIDLTSI